MMPVFHFQISSACKQLTTLCLSGLCLLVPGLPDSYEGTQDIDGDGVPNYLDLDRCTRNPKS